MQCNVFLIFEYRCPETLLQQYGNSTGFQKGLFYLLFLFLSYPLKHIIIGTSELAQGKMYGAFAAEDIQKDELISEYTGEVPIVLLIFYVELN